MKTYLISGKVQTDIDIHVLAENEEEARKAIIRQIQHVSGSKMQNLINLTAKYIPTVTLPPKISIAEDATVTLEYK